MMNTEFDLGGLWPDFSNVYNLNFTTPEGLSAAVVAILFTVAIVFAVISIFNSVKAHVHLKFYRNLIDGVQVEQLMEKRREIANQALTHKKYGRLWREFDESLVNIPQKQRLCNTLDAAHFFNTHSLARGLTENRLLAAVPGFLTAIGVIGTFAGLQLGLGPLGSMDPESAKVEELTHGIFGMIGGASIAFMTSVWGVLISVLFNFFEKALERQIRASITSFQNEVDFLYPRITAEQSLTSIEDFTRQSNDRLAELDEKIGHKMQEAIREASGAIREGMEHSLNSILGPAIERLVDNAHSGSEKALESLLEKFLAGVGSAGEQQRNLMEKSAREMAQASGSVTAGLQSFVTNMDKQIANMMEQNAEMLTKVNFAAEQQWKEHGQREAERQHKLNHQMDSFQEAQGQLTKGIGEVLETQKQQANELVSGLSALIERFESLSNSHENATTAMQKAAFDINGASNQMGLLSTALKTALDDFGTKLKQSLDVANEVTQKNVQAGSVFDRVTNELAKTGETIERVAGTFNEAASKADSGLNGVNQHFDALGKTLQAHIAELENQVSKLLQEYADRVNNQTVQRLNVWNQETNNYISAMTDAVHTLSGVVDDIDTKVAAARR